MGIQWVNARGASLDKLLKHGKLWVADHLPETGEKQMEVWAAWAEQGDSMHRLVAKWSQDRLYGLPRGGEARSARFMASLQQMFAQRVLVVHDADLLKGGVLDKMRLLAEEGALVVLVGDVSKIDVATRKYPGFYQRAGYCVQVTDLWDGAALAQPKCGKNAG